MNFSEISKYLCKIQFSSNYRVIYIPFRIICNIRKYAQSIFDLVRLLWMVERVKTYVTNEPTSKDSFLNFLFCPWEAFQFLMGSLNYLINIGILSLSNLNDSRKVVTNGKQKLQLRLTLIKFFVKLLCRNRKYVRCS